MTVEIEKSGQWFRRRFDGKPVKAIKLLSPGEWTFSDGHVRRSDGRAKFFPTTYDYDVTERVSSIFSPC